MRTPKRSNRRFGGAHLPLLQLHDLVALGRCKQVDLLLTKVHDLLDESCAFPATPPSVPPTAHSRERYYMLH